MTTGLALKLKLELARLRAEHGLADRAEPLVLPLTEASVGPMIFEGRAATSDVDRERMKFQPFCFGMVSARNVRLLYRHDATQVAGEIEELR